VGTFSAPHWKNIEADLDAVGINIDKVRVGEPFKPGEPWWLPDHKTTVRMQSLRNALQGMAWHYAVVLGVSFLRNPPTPLQQTESVRKALDAVLAIERELSANKISLADPDTPFEQDLDERLALWRRSHPAFAGDDVFSALAHAFPADAIKMALPVMIDRLQRQIAKLEAQGSSKDSARKVHIDFWRELARLWLALKPKVSSRLRRRHLRRFLFDCSASLLADVMTEGEIESKIDAFVGNFFKGKRSL
jgi:hypothetical protein